MPTTSHAAAYSFVERLAQDLKDARFELPAFPEAVLRVQRALQSPDTSASDIVAILSSDPGLAANVLRIANSASFRPASGEITDLRNAVSRLGFNMVRTVAVEFAMRQLRRRDVQSPVAKNEIETIWRDSLKVASLCYVMAKHYTRVNADQALLTGLLHGLGRLYIVMRAEEMKDVSAVDIREVAHGWQATIGKSILESWGLPEPLQHAVEHQDDVESTPAGTDESGGPGVAVGAVTLTDILIAAKALIAEREATGADVPALRWLNAMKSRGAAAVLEDHDEEIQSLRAS
ncbi:MAG TPA: HDOD domain-containing protein, partial [Woeseiaceae bacterium]|nr:HDOD domain-containing protein [Woeseiaceae bacterium]